MKHKNENETWKWKWNWKHENENMKMKHELWNMEMKHENETSGIIRSYVRWPFASVDGKDSLWKRRWHDSHVGKGYPFS